MTSQDKLSIIIDEEDGEEVQCLGEMSPFQPNTPRQTACSSVPSSPLSSATKRKRDSTDRTDVGILYLPRSRQARSAQSLSKSQWTFGDQRSNVTFGSAVEVLSPRSTTPRLPTTPSRVSMSMRSINLDAEDEFIIVSPPNVGRLSLVSEETTGPNNENHAYLPGGRSDDLDEGWQILERRLFTLGQSANAVPILRKPVIDLEDDDDLASIPFVAIDSDSDIEFDFEITGSTTRSNDTALVPRRSSFYPQRNPAIFRPLSAIAQIEINGFSVRHSSTVELTDGDFLQIISIVRNVESGDVTLRGHRFQRNRDLNGLLPKKRNELCWTVDIDQDDDRPVFEQSLAEVPISCVSRPREIHITNLRFPAASYRDSPYSSNPRDVERDAQVTVRWSYTRTWPSTRAREGNERNTICEHVLKHLTEGDELVGSQLRMRDEEVKFAFRGPTERGGSYDPANPPRCHNQVRKRADGAEMSWRRSDCSIKEVDEQGQESTEKTNTVDLTDEPSKAKKPRASAGDAVQEGMLGQIDLTTPEPSLPASSGVINSPKAANMKKIAIKRVPGQKYTYGDAFCGAGGASRGAQMAGLKVLWGCDFDAYACQTWRANFPMASMFEMSVYDLCRQYTDGKVSLRCDILHLSPPCQFFSPAHTIPGKDDDMNSASLLACGQLLKAVKPRIVTLEQTFGISFAEYRGWFNALIQMFTENGYSLRWKICHLQDWGLPQRRQRLIIIASCPGEILPHFPPYTHHRQPSLTSPRLRPYTSVNSVLSSIPRSAPDHDLATAHAKPIHERPWDGSGIAPRAITTHGGQNYHPSGTRNLTNREFAALQGFPAHHVFSERNVKKQIGNAVPPSIARVLFEAVRRALEVVDGVEGVGNQEGGVVLVID